MDPRQKIFAERVQIQEATISVRVMKGLDGDFDIDLSINNSAHYPLAAYDLGFQAYGLKGEVIPMTRNPKESLFHLQLGGNTSAHVWYDLRHTRTLKEVEVAYRGESKRIRVDA